MVIYYGFRFRQQAKVKELVRAAVNGATDIITVPTWRRKKLELAPNN
ncbi:hypothetical protein [Geobacillus sp. C56-T2]|nr:hypothetical protein [Geobacillus sp. C56-T2]